MKMRSIILVVLIVAGLVLAGGCCQFCKDKKIDSPSAPSSDPVPEPTPGDPIVFGPGGSGGSLSWQTDDGSGNAIPVSPNDKLVSGLASGVTSLVANTADNTGSYKDVLGIRFQTAWDHDNDSSTDPRTTWVALVRSDSCIAWSIDGASVETCVAGSTDCTGIPSAFAAPLIGEFQVLRFGEANWKTGNKVKMRPADDTVCN